MTQGPEGPDVSTSPPPDPARPQGIPDSALYGAPGPPEVPTATEPPLGNIGDITITQSTVVTPAGTFPLRGSVWTATDMSRTEEYLPAYAIVLAIIFFVFCLLGLLFLLMKAKKTTGFVQVTVNGGGRHHSTMIPVSHPQQVYDVIAQVSWARSLAAA